MDLEYDTKIYVVNEMDVEMEEYKYIRKLDVDGIIKHKLQTVGGVDVYVNDSIFKLHKFKIHKHNKYDYSYYISKIVALGELESRILDKLHKVQKLMRKHRIEFQERESVYDD